MDNIINNNKLINGQFEQYKYPPPKQSANTLFNFMPRLSYLKTILSNKAIIPRYVNEDIKYLNISTDNIAIPMTCFCDINMQRILWHTKTYGQYGIAFHKDWSIEKGIQPIHYINQESFFIKEYSETFVSAERYSGNDKEIEILQNYLLTHLAFMKPLYSQSNIKNLQNYHDEREWRYVPNMSSINTEMPQFLWGKNSNKNSREDCNEALKYCKGSWLNFEWTDIRYILLPDDKAQNKLIKHIQNLKNISDNDRILLYSKLICLQSLREDI